MNKRYGFEKYGFMRYPDEGNAENSDSGSRCHRGFKFLPTPPNFVGDTEEDSPGGGDCLKAYFEENNQPIRAIAEYEEMGGVVIAYVGTDSPPPGHTQLPPTGRRTFGIPDELIIRMQQNDTDKPVHVFILCNDPDEEKNIIEQLKKSCDELNSRSRSERTKYILGKNSKSEDWGKLSFNPDLIHLIPWDADTYWTRDYAPWWVEYKKENKDGKKVFAISKHIYTTLGGGAVGLVEGAENVNPRIGSGIFRCNDDYGAVKISDYLNAPIREWNKAEWGSDKTVKLDPIPTHDWFFSGLLNVGGNYMVTSKGIIASSYLVATQNELPTDDNKEDPSQADWDNRMKYIMNQTNRFLGANKYIAVVDPTGTYIGHIDCWGKFLSDEDILIASVADKKIDEKFSEIQKAFEDQGTFVDTDGQNNLKDPEDHGKPFRVTRVKAPNVFIPGQGEDSVTTAPYTNSLILNKCVYVPVLDGENYADSNIEALKAYEKALNYKIKNGYFVRKAESELYTIIGIPPKPETPWFGTDALHCRTNAIPRGVVDNWLKSLDVNAAAEKLLENFLNHDDQE